MSQSYLAENDLKTWSESELAAAQQQLRVALVALYQRYYPLPHPELQTRIDEMELEFLQTDLPQLFQSMQVGAERICQIVLSLRSFSRLDEAAIKPVDLHDGIDSTLMILQTKAPGKGTGLGLSISYQIITERHGGKLSCISELGQGTQFKIEIPVRHSDHGIACPKTM